MPSQDLTLPERIRCVLEQNGYREVNRSKKHIVMRDNRANGGPNIQEATILVPIKTTIAPDIIGIISRKSGVPKDQLT